MNLEVIIKEKLDSLSKINIIIAGMTCSGKTTLAKMIKNEFTNSVSLISQDSYFKDLEKIPRNANGYLMDSLNAFNTEEFIEDIEILLEQNQTYIPNYDICKNKRAGKNILIKKGEINIFEGLHTITLLKGLASSLSIYIEAPISVCLKRRIDRDCNNYKVTEQQVRKNFDDCILPISKIYIESQKELADIIVDERGKVLCR